MSHTYSSNLVHCVFSTKGRSDSIPELIQEELYAYMFGVARNLGIEILALGGVANHVHVLLALPATKTLSNTIRDLKANTSRWMKQNQKTFAWQEGFGAFSVSPSQVTVVKAYIRNQAEHHRRRNFEEEFVAMLRKSGNPESITIRNGCLGSAASPRLAHASGLPALTRWANGLRSSGAS